MIPEIIHDFMRQGAALVVSISGGKDSQAMAKDLRNDAAHNPELAQHYIQLEVVGGSTFKSGKSLAEICDGCS